MPNARVAMASPPSPTPRGTWVPRGGAGVQRSGAAVETCEGVVCGLVGCGLGRVVVAGVEEDDGHSAAVVVDPDVGLVAAAAAAPAVGLAGAAARIAALPEVLALHLRELLPVEQLAAHERGEEAGGVLGVGDDAALGADTPVPVG